MAKPVKLRRRGELAPGVRGERIIYLNGGSQVVANESGISSGRATQVASLPVPAPQNVVAAILRLRLNPTGAGTFNLFAHSSRANSGSTQAVAGTVISGALISECQASAPLVDGGVCFETTVPGGVTYTYTIYLVGFIVA